MPPHPSYVGQRALSTTHRVCSPPGPPIAQTPLVRCRNLDLLSIDYAFRPRLRPDFPWVDHPPPGTLGLPVARILTVLSRYSFRHSHLAALHHPFQDAFTAAANAPLPLPAPNGHPPGRKSAASVAHLSPDTFSARNHWTSELLRTRSRMAASTPTSWLSGRFHILVHSVHTSGP